jgi:hypothetical protein
MHSLSSLFLLTYSFVVTAFAPAIIISHSALHHHRQNQQQLFMFTGIVEEMGTVVSLIHRDDMELWDGSKGSGTELVIEANLALQDAYLGYVCNRIDLFIHSPSILLHSPSHLLSLSAVPFVSVAFV